MQAAKTLLLNELRRKMRRGDVFYASCIIGIWPPGRRPPGDLRRTRQTNALGHAAQDPATLLRQWRAATIANRLCTRLHNLHNEKARYAARKTLQQKDLRRKHRRKPFVVSCCIVGGLARTHPGGMQAISRRSRSRTAGIRDSSRSIDPGRGRSAGCETFRFTDSPRRFEIRWCRFAQAPANGYEPLGS